MRHSTPSPGGGENKRPAPQTLREAFVSAADQLREAGIEAPELDARLLLCHAAGLAHEDFVARAGEVLPPRAFDRLQAHIERRAAREPVSRITGVREFYGRHFLIEGSVLDPRPDTETVVEAALDLIETRRGRGASLRLIDLGTGSGCILLTLLAELPNARGLGTDLSRDALRVAHANAERLGVADRASFTVSDWLDAVSGEFDLVLSNPPYIARGEIGGLAAEVARYDPHIALDGGGDGLDAYRRIASGAAKVLAPGGHILLEIGATQADAVTSLLCQGGFLAEKINHRRDLAGRPRVIVAEM
ncbi:peptide chain release factor N(5)-glutamine methyltransferase [Methyloceanibacter sp.]|uniref:peptide chain release factor N(5)-glutamine methyltransferase n=1 Tax=Methyloceanibacter sp. TaxID=1965321 RepID=UPI0039C956A4